MTDRVCTKEEVLQRLVNARSRLWTFGILRIGLFGSFARNEQGPDSDIDLLVEFSPEMHTFDNFMDANFFLEQLLGRRVELVTPEGLSPYIGPRILQEVVHVQIAA